MNNLHNSTSGLTKSRKYEPASKKKKQPQRVIILNHLLSGEPISQLVATNRYNITSMFPHITKLMRETNLPIDKRWMGTGQEKYCEYFINFEEWIFKHLSKGAAVSNPFLTNHFKVAVNFNAIIDRVIKSHPEAKFVYEWIHEDGGYRRTKMKA
jgi:hypothetical protein